MIHGLNLKKIVEAGFEKTMKNMVFWSLSTIFLKNITELIEFSQKWDSCQLIVLMNIHGMNLKKIVRAVFEKTVKNMDF